MGGNKIVEYEPNKSKMREFNKKIKPHIEELIKKCEELGIPFVFSFEIQNKNNSARIISAANVPGEASDTISHTALLAKGGEEYYINAIIRGIMVISKEESNQDLTC